MLVLAGASLLAITNAQATTLEVPDNTNLNTLIPANGDTWNLQGNAFLSSDTPWDDKILPDVMTINGTAGVSTITLNDAAGYNAVFGYDNPYSWPDPYPSATLNLSNVRFIADAGVLSTQSTTNMVVNIANHVSFEGTTTEGYAQAIYVADGIVLNGAAGSTLSFTNNAYGFYTSTGNVIFTGNYDNLSLSQNDIGVFTKGSSLYISGNNYGHIRLDNNYIAAEITGNAIIDPENVIGDISISNNAAGAIRADYVIIAPDAVAGVLRINNNGGRQDPSRWDGGTGAIHARDSIMIDGAYGGIEMIGNHGADTNNLVNGGALSAGDVSPWSTSLGYISVTPTTGTMAVRSNSATGDGGAFSAVGNVMVWTGGATDFTANAAGNNGGAISVLNDVSLSTTRGNMTFSGNSAMAKGGAIWAGGNVLLHARGGDITFTGNTHGDPIANAIWFDNTASDATASFHAEAGRAITFFDPIENNDANGVMAVDKTGVGLLSFDGSLHGDEPSRWSKMLAHTNVFQGTFEVANWAVYGAFSTDAASATAPTSFTSASGSMVQGGRVGTIMADSVTLNGDVSIAGRQPDVRGVLNIATNTLALGGGTFHFNTHLDDGTSGNTDVLVLDLHGSAIAGQSFITVTNAGGNGALTLNDGIKLVETNGTGTTDGAFMLTGRVSAGAYDYLLFQGGVDNNAEDQNWYLRSTYNPPPTPPGCEFTDTCIPQEPVPIIRDEVAVSMAVPPLAIEYGYSMLGTLHERVGETYINNAAPVTEERVVWCKDASQNFKCVVRVPVSNAKDETRWASSGWARLMGDRGLNQPDNFSKRGPNYDYTFGGIQAGLDLYAHEEADGTLDKAGIYVGYGQISSNVKGQFGGKAGTVDMDAYTVGGYWTHYAASGWYTDAVVQGTWYAADAKSVYGQRIKPDGFGILASLEAGYAFKLGNGFTIEPQAQIAYQNISFDSARDAYGFVRFDDGESLRGRLGVRVTKSWNMADDANPRLVTAWLRANIWHEFMGKTKTAWGSLDGQNMTPFNATFGGTWGEIGAGVTAQVSDKVNLFATGAYNRSLDNKGRQGWDGRLGFNVKW